MDKPLRLADTSKPSHPVTLDPLTLINALLAVVDVARTVGDPESLDSALADRLAPFIRGGSPELAHNIELAARALLELRSPHARKPLEDHLIGLGVSMNHITRRQL